MMKSRIVILLGIVLLSLSSTAQAPDGVNYQAVVRDIITGLPLNGQTVDVRFTIHQTSPSGPTIFTETHTSILTNQFGLINLELGSVDNVNFSGINWGTGGPHYLQIEVDAGGGFDNLGASQLLSVPFALFARSAATGAQGFNSLVDTASATGAQCPTGGYVISSGLDANANTILDPGEITSSIIVCNGTSGAAITSDTSATNEIQTISINAAQDTIFLSNGGFVELPSLGNDNWGTDVVNTSGTNITGDGTLANPLAVIDNDTSSTNELELPLTGNTLGDIMVWNGSAWVSQAPSSGTDADADGWPSTMDLDDSNNLITFYDNDNDSTNEFQNLSWSNADSNIIQISNGTGVSLSSNAPATNEVLTWNGANWVALAPSGTDNQNLLNGGKVTNAQTINIQNGTGVTFSVSDEDSLSTNEIQQITFTDPVLSLSLGGGSVSIPDTDPNNERIIAFSVNGTNDSLAIVESGVRHTMPLSDFNDGDWTKGTGNDIFNNTDSVGIGTNDPKSPLQIGDKMHLFPFSFPGPEEYSVSTFNVYKDGAGAIRTTSTGPSAFMFMGHTTGNPNIGLHLYGSQPVGTDITAFNPDTKFNVNNKGVVVNGDNADAAIELDPVDSAAILIEVPDDLSEPTILFSTQNGNHLGIKAPTNLSSGSFQLRLPTALPGNTGAPLISDLGGNLSWGTPATPLWNTSGTDISNANTGNVGIGTATPSAKLEVTDDILVNSIIIGKGSGNLNGNVVFGEGAFVGNSTGTNNTAIGNYALQQNAGGGENVALGFGALGSNTSGYGNVGLGRAALPNTVGGFQNVGVGDQVMFNNTSGFYNVAIGKTAMLTNTTGSRITTIGVNSDVAAGNLTNATAIGADAVVGASNSLVLGNNANVGIGTSTPSSKLHLEGTLRLANLGGVAPTSGAVLTAIDAQGNAQWQTIATPITFWNGSAGAVYPATLSDNVGIGTTGPTTRLDIFGSSNSTSVSGFWTSPETTIKVHNTDQTNNNFSSLTFATTLDNGGSTEMGRIAVQNINHTAGSSEGDLVFITRNPGTLSEKMRINGNGNVGIGLSSPTSRLHVQGSGNTVATSAFNVQNSAGTTMFYVRDDGFTGVNATIAIGQANFVVNDNNNSGYGGMHVNVNSSTGQPFYGYSLNGTATAWTYLDGTDANKLKWYTGASVKMSLGTNGLLDVEGDVEIDGDYTYESAKTNYYSIGVSEMELYTGSPGYSLTKNFTSGAPNYMYMTGGTAGLSGYAHAPVHLPHGAVVTDLQMTVYDNDGSVTGEVGLYRVSNGSSGVMATCQSFDVAGINTYNDPTVNNATIDNSNYSYGLRIIGNQNGGTNLRFYNVVITYTVTKAD